MIDLGESIRTIQESRYLVKLRDAFVENKSLPEPQTEDEKMLKFVYGGHKWGGSIRWKESICLYAICKKCKNFLEIGQLHGVSTRLFGLMAKENNGKVVSIDPKPYDHNENDFKMLGVSDYIQTIKESTPWINLKQNWEFDAIFIDGDHSFITVLVDYHCFNYYLKQSGFIAFHDTGIREVSDAIYEIKKRDKIEYLYGIERLQVFRKTALPKETYFQRIRK